MLTVGYLGVAVCLPLVGTLVDYTPRRRQVGLGTAYALIAIQLVQMLISARTWKAMAALQVCAQVVYLLHLVPHFAHIPELTRDDAEASAIQASGLGGGYVASLGTLVVIVAAGRGPADSARLAQALSGAALLATLPLAWHRLNGDRPALQKLPPGASLLTEGFRTLRETATHLRADYPELWKLVCGLSCWEASTSAFLSLLPTYLAVFADMTATQIGACLGVALVATIVGAFGSKALLRRHSPKAVVLGALSGLAALAFLMPLCVHGPQHKDVLYGFGALVGLGNGVVYPAQRVLFTKLIPGGREAQMWGIYAFAGAVWVWVPPLVFTVINEVVGMRFAIWSLCALYAVGIPQGLRIDLAKAEKDVAATLARRHYADGAGGAPPPKDAASSP